MHDSAGRIGGIVGCLKPQEKKMLRDYRRFRGSLHFNHTDEGNPEHAGAYIAMRGKDEGHILRRVTSTDEIYCTKQQNDRSRKGTHLGISTTKPVVQVANPSQI